MFNSLIWGFPGATVVKNPPDNAGDAKEMWVPSLCPEDPLVEEMASHSSTLTGKFHGQRTLEGSDPWGRKEQDTTKHNK